MQNYFIFNMNFFGFGNNAKIDIQLDGADDLPQKLVKEETKRGGVLSRSVPIFEDSQDICGKVCIKTSKSLDHIGIKIELYGVIELLCERGSKQEFTSIVRELAPPGSLSGSSEYEFQFLNVDKPHESYMGINANLRYYLRATVTRSYSSNVVAEKDFWVQKCVIMPEINNSIKMEVGIEECLHIEFEYDKAKYHLNDIVIGKIYFLLVRIKIKHMELAIIKREQAGSGANVYSESETLQKFEIMDGAPVRGESIPVRLFLSSFALTPTMRNVNNKFSVKFFLNLVLVDEEDRRYFKQQEITIWRKEIRGDEE